MRKLLVAAGVVAMLSTVAGPALAATNPSGTGQPSVGCLETSATALEPGQAATARGSAFNENGGIAGAVYAGNGVSTTTPANAAAVSQYDVACYQVTQKP